MELKPVDAREFSRIMLYMGERIEERFRLLNDIAFAFSNAQSTLNQNFKKFASILSAGNYPLDHHFSYRRA